MQFVVFAEDWGRHPSSTQHIFNVIAAHHDIIWFNSVGMRKPKLNSTDAKRLIGKAKLMLSGHAKQAAVKSDIDTRNPILLPWHDNPMVTAFNRYQVAKELGECGNDPIVYWVSVPSAINLIHLRPQDRLIYYCGDDFSSLAGVDHQLIKDSEERLINQADRIFVVSKVLLDKMPKHKTQMLEHGVDLPLFTEPKTPSRQIQNLKNVVGFYGSLSKWLDTELLYKLAKLRPNYQLLLIGQAHIDISKLLTLPNVTHIAQVAHQQLASFSQHWQVSLLPFLDNDQIKACNPLKLKEYLAVGKPIVATNFPAVTRYQDVVLIGADHSGFIARVDQAMMLSHTSTIDWRSHSQQLVAQHSWQQKAAFVLEQMEKSFAKCKVSHSLVNNLN